MPVPPTLQDGSACSFADGMTQDFRVIDTEGTPVLREVAVYSSRGELLLEARVPDEEDSYFAADLVRPLPDLLRELRHLVDGYRVVAHNAVHDRGVLEASFQTCGLNPPQLDWDCTLTLAQDLHPQLESYALGSLCDQLGVAEEPFCRDQAHRAAYDARYTYSLYRALQREQLCRQLSRTANPFNSSRVDTPFQTFADDRKVNQAAFQRLSSVLRSVSADPNQQSQGAVLIGEPGTGKTHLVMRLAREVLQNNRLLFVRQPTQAGHVLFHIYSRTLESLVEQVSGTGNTQLELLLIRAIRRIWVDDDSDVNSDREIRSAMDAEDLSRLGFDGSDARRRRWERIEIRLLRWWGDQQGAAGYGRQILQGLLRFCRYTDPRLRESCRRWLATGEHEPVERELDGLSAWNDGQLREEFSLQAMRVIGMLCSLDQPLILVFDQLEGLWLEGNRPVLMSFGQVVRELFTHVPHALILLTLFPDRWQAFQQDFDGSITDRVGQHLIPLEQPRPELLEEIIDLRLQPLGATARSLFRPEDLGAILGQPSIRRGLNRAGSFYEHLVNGLPLPRDQRASPVQPIFGSQDTSLPSRMLQLEQQLEQVITRLARLEAAPQPGQAVLDASSIGQVDGGLERNSPVPIVEPVAEQESATSNLTEVESEFLRYRDSCRTTLEQRWQKAQIVDGSDDAGKLTQICLAHEQILPIKTDALKLGSKRVPDNVLIRTKQRSWCVAFLHVSNANAITARLNNLNQLITRQRHIHFILMRDGFSSTIRSPGAMAAMEAFRNGSGDGLKRTHWKPLDLERRVALEFSFQLVTDILNREVDIPLADGLNLLARHEPDNWVIKLLRSA